ncbi:MAG: methylmalonyl-CoA epimerase [Desulfitobacteriaceae bacterium]
MNNLIKVDHIGIAVGNLAEAIKLYETLGLSCTHRETIVEQKVNTATLPLSETKLELLEPTDANSSVGKFLATKGGGLHHIAIEVENIEEKLLELKNQGLHLIDETPRQGVAGSRIAFLHPKSTSGTLIELVQVRR